MNPLRLVGAVRALPQRLEQMALSHVQSRLVRPGVPVGPDNPVRTDDPHQPPILQLHRLKKPDEVFRVNCKGGNPGKTSVNAGNPAADNNRRFSEQFADKRFANKQRIRSLVPVNLEIRPVRIVSCLRSRQRTGGNPPRLVQNKTLQ